MKIGDHVTAWWPAKRHGCLEMEIPVRGVVSQVRYVQTRPGGPIGVLRPQSSDGRSFSAAVETGRTFGARRGV